MTVPVYPRCMGLFSQKDKDDRPMTPDELNERSKVDGIRFKELQVVAQLSRMGADLRAPRDAIFYLYFPAEEAAAPAAEVLQGLGFSVEVREPLDSGDPWGVVARRDDLALIPDFLRTTVDVCEDLAARHGGEFDGWEAGLTAAEAAAVRE